MADDTAVEDRKTGSPKPQQSKVGSRGTHTILYQFELPVTPALREKASDLLEFHLHVWDTLFGPRVHQTSFVSNREYRPPEFRHDSFAGRLRNATFFYALNKVILDRIGLLPRVKPWAITEDGRPIMDLAGYSGPMAVNAGFAGLQEDVAEVFRSTLGVDVADLTFWNRMDFFTRSQVIQEFERVIPLLDSLDDEAVVALLADRPVRRSKHTHTRRLTLWDIQEFRKKLERLKQQTDDRARDERLLDYDLHSDATSLVGCHPLYFKVREYERIQFSELVPVEQKGQRLRANPGVEPSPRLRALTAEIEAMRERKGFGPNTLSRLEKRFRDNFQKRAAAFARRQLNHHRRLLEYYVDRTDIRYMAHDIRDYRAAFFLDLFNLETLRSLKKIKETLARSNERLADLTKRYPLISYINFWTLYQDAKVSENIFDSRARNSFSEGQFRYLILQTRRSIRVQLKELERPAYVWKGDVIVEGALRKFDLYADPADGESHHAMLTDIVRRKVRQERNRGVLKGIVLAVLAFALSLTGVGLLVAAGIVLSIADVYLMIEDRADITYRKLTGLSAQNPPSDFWILLAVAGVGADISGFVKMVSVGKAGKILDSAQEMRFLLHKIGQVSDKAHDVVNARRVIKIELEMAVTKLAARISETGTLSQAASEILDVAYHLSRLGFKSFKHFVLEMSRRGLLKKALQIEETAPFDTILAKLDEDSFNLLTRLHLKGLSKGKSAIARLEEIESLLAANEREYLKWQKRARELWDKRRKGSRSDPDGNYLKLRDEHLEARAKRDALKTTVDKLKVERKVLNPEQKMSNSAWGEALETQTLRNEGWPVMESANVKSVDSVRRGNDGVIEAMQHKGIVFPSTSELESKVGAKIRESKRNFASDKYTRFVKQFNGDTIPRGKTELGFEMPTKWDDPDLRIVLEIKIVSETPVDLDALLHHAYAVFYEEFPESAILNLRHVHPSEVLEDLQKFSKL